MNSQTVKSCVACDKEFTKMSKLSYAQWEARQFCSNRCSATWKYNHNVGSMQKDKGPWNKGTKGLMGKNVTCFTKQDPRITGEKNYQWQGEYPSYTAVHKWLRKHYGKAQKCEFCGDPARSIYHWSNVSGEYKREINDWQQLCVPCHSMYDKGHMFVW